MSQRKNYHPSGMTWRERELQKEKDRKEAEIRAKEEERLRGVQPTEENFPSLGGVVAKPKPLTNSGMFAKLASEWKDHEDIEKEREQKRKEQEERNAQRERSMMYAPNRMGRKSWYVDARDSDSEEESHTPKYGNPLEDEWKTVEYKHRDPRKPKFQYYENEPSEDMNEDYEQNTDILQYDN